MIRTTYQLPSGGQVPWHMLKVYYPQISWGFPPSPDVLAMLNIAVIEEVVDITVQSPYTGGHGA